MINMLKKGSPYFKQIEEDIREKIDAGIYKPHDKIPPEPELKDHYQASVTTIRKAIEQLCIDGMLVKHQGKGTFVQLVPKRVGLVSPNISSSWMPMWNALKKYSENNNIHLRIYPYKWTDGKEFQRELAICTEENDGVIIFPPYPPNSENLKYFDKLNREDFPMVFIETGPEDYNCPAYTVKIDYYRGFRKLLDELHGDIKSYAFLVDPAHSTGTSLIKLTGDLHINGSMIKTGNFQHDNQTLFRAIDELLELKKKPSMIICFSSLTLLRSFLYLNSKGIKVPEDIALAGAGNLSTMSNLLIPIPALSFPRDQLGEKAGMMIYKRLSKQPVEQSYELIPEVIILNKK